MEIKNGKQKTSELRFGSRLSKQEEVRGRKIFGNAEPILTETVYKYSPFTFNGIGLELSVCFISIL